MSEIIPKDMKETSIAVGQMLMERYWMPLYEYLHDHPELKKTFTGFLLKPHQLIFYFGKTHLGIEYVGNEQLGSLSEDGHTAQLTYHDLTRSEGNFLEQIIGFEFDSTIPVELPLPPYLDEMILPTNKGFDKLVEMGWNFIAQNSILTINGGKHFIPEKQFTRLVNSLFFDANEYGLKTRHIKWIDFVPLSYNDTNEGHDIIDLNIAFFNDDLVKHDAHYIYPLPPKSDFKFSKLPQINRFVELIGNYETSEPAITTFLSKEENQFILTMGFFSTKIFPQLKCEWQSEDRQSIQPDYFVLQPNGFANIVEFKLPNLKSKALTGKINRETFSAEINSYISQTRSYKSYFGDPNNRKWFESKYNIKVLHPKRYLVVGRRWEFKSDDWKEIIADYKDIEIVTYDDLIDGVMAQFYI